MTTWTIGDVSAATFRSFARNWVALVFGNIVAGLIMLSPIGLTAAVTMPMLIHAAQNGSAAPPVAIAAFFFSLVPTVVLATLFAPALARIALAAARDERPRLSAIFDFRRAATYLGAAIVGALVTMAAGLLLIVPGIIVALGLVFTSYFVVDDARLGVSDALEASWDASRGHRAHLCGLLVLFGSASWLLQLLLGATVVLVPLQVALMAVSTPLQTLLIAHVYLQITPKRTPTS